MPFHLRVRTRPKQEEADNPIQGTVGSELASSKWG
jgi:hypothetical protein